METLFPEARSVILLFVRSAVESAPQSRFPPLPHMVSVAMEVEGNPPINGSLSPTAADSRHQEKMSERST